MLQRHPSPCYPSRSCVVFLSCVLLTMSRAWYLYPESCVVSSRCGNNYVNFLDFTLFNSSLSTPALFRTHSLVFFAVQDTRSNSRKTFTSKALNRFLHFSWVSNSRIMLLTATKLLSLTWLSNQFTQKRPLQTFFSDPPTAVLLPNPCLISFVHSGVFQSAERYSICYRSLS